MENTSSNRLKTTSWAIVGLMALLALSFYVAVGETGPIGWINAAQASVFGGYSRKISMLVLMAAVGVPVLVIWAIASPTSLQGRAQKVSAVTAAPLGPLPNATTAMKWLLCGWLGFVAIVWAGAYGYSAWQRHVRIADAAASYVPLELVPGMKDAAAGHDHLAVRGRLLGDHVVSRKAGSNGSEAMMLLPVVERGWREGDPVHFVVRFGAQGESALRSALQQQPSESLLVRTDGSIPTLARQVFERMRAPLADDAVAVVLIDAQGGAPAAVRADGGNDDVVTWGAIGTGGVTLVFAMIAAAMVGSARQTRKQAARGLKR